MKHNKGARWTAVLLIAAFAAAGAAAVLATDRYQLRLDMTENDLYTLSETSTQLVSSLSEDVAITVFNTEAEFPLLPGNLLKSYQGLSDKLTVRWCDPYLQPRTVRTYEEKGLTIELNDLLVEANGRQKQLKLTDLYQLSADGASVEKLKAEQMITSAISETTGTERAMALFTDGHGEHVGATLMTLFENNHFQTAYTTLAVLGIDPNAAILVICAPERDFSAEDVKTVGAYLQGGGSVMAFLEPGSDRLENLSAFLSDWGIAPGDGVIAEPTLNVSGSAGNVAATYAAHDINRFFTDNRYYVVTPATLPLEQVFISRGATSTQTVLRTSGSAYVTLTDGTAKTDAPFALAMTAQRESTTADGTATGRLFVCGSCQIYGDDLLGTASLANRDFIVQSAAWLTGEPDLISIPAKEMGAPFLPMVAADAQRWMTLMLIVWPLAILFGGLAIAWRRRNL